MCVKNYNMKRYILLFSLIGCFTIALTAQSNVVASGGDASGSGGTVSYSVGQVDYTTKSGANGIVTEGLQQPFEISVVTGIDEVGIDLKAVVFPNPASDYIELQIDDLENQVLNYALYDIDGKVITRDTIVSNVTTISISALPVGIYFLGVSGNGRVIKTFKISTTK